MKKKYLFLLVAPFMIATPVFADTQEEIKNIETEIKVNTNKIETLKEKSSETLEKEKTEIEKKIDKTVKKSKTSNKELKKKKEEKKEVENKVEERKEELKSSFGFAKLASVEGDKRSFLDKVVDLVTFQDRIVDDLEVELQSTTKETKQKEVEVETTEKNIKRQEKEKKSIEVKLTDLEKENEKIKKEKEEITKKTEDLKASLNNKKKQAEEERKAEERRKEIERIEAEGLPQVTETELNSDPQVIGLTPWTAKMKIAIGKKFNIRDYSTFRPGDGGEHGKGLAVDYMVYNNEKLGDDLAQYVINHMNELGIDYVIWKQRFYSKYNSIYGAGGTWGMMEDRGSITENHYDHVHISFLK